MQDIKIFACPTAEDFTKEIADHLGLPLGKINFMKFKNDNNFVQILESVREQDVFIVQTIMPPVNERLMELLIAVDAIKRASAKRITAILPYFPYARTDKKDQPRVPITSKLVASMIEAAGVDRVLTCDLHNPSIQGFFDIYVDQLKAKDLLKNYFLSKKLEDLVVVATDAGSSKNAARYSHPLNAKIALLDKRRVGNDDRAIGTHIIGDVKDKTAIIFDDEVDTAGSMVETINALYKHGVKQVYCGATHGVLSGPAIERLQNCNITELVLTNTVPIPKEKRIDKITVLSIAPLFADAVKRINEAKPMGELFEE